MKLMRIGVDLAKNVFQIHGVDRHEQPVWRQRLFANAGCKRCWRRLNPAVRSAWKVVAVRTIGRGNYKHVDFG